MKKYILLLLLTCSIGKAQYNLFVRQNFAKSASAITYNTEIGGVSATISTASALATKLGISVGAISNFTIVGSDIKCKITGNYSIPANAFVTDATLTYYDDVGKLVTSIGNSTFNGCSSLTYLYLPEAATLGTTTGNNGCFQNIPADTVLYLKPSLATAQGGAEEGDVAYARTINCIVRYVANYTAPSAITTLTAGTIYNSSVQMNFTPPSSTNTIDYYETYIGGVFKSRIRNNGNFISPLSASTSYTGITIVAVDIYRNKSIVSNSISVTTTNRSAVDSDAIAYVSASSNSAYQDIIDDFFVSLKSASLYAKIQALYPLLGTTATQQKWNAKNPLDTDAAFRLTFNGGGTFSNLGYQLNGINAFAETYFVPSVQQSTNSNGATIVTGTNNFLSSTGVAVELGSYNGGSQASFISSKRIPGGRKDAHFNGNVIVQDVGTNESRCILTGMRVSASVSKMVKNASIIGTGSGGGTLPTFGFQIGRLSLANGQYSTQRIQTVMFHEGLSDAEVATLHTIIDTFESAIGRKTW